MRNESWLTRNWRPLAAMLLTVTACQGIVRGQVLPEGLWTLITVFAGVYGGSRGLEKLAHILADSGTLQKLTKKDPGVT